MVTLYFSDLPVIAWFVFLTVLLLAIFDARRYSMEPWYKWLVPAGWTLLFLSIGLLNGVLMVLSAGVIGLGVALSKMWRTRHDRKSTW